MCNFENWLAEGIDDPEDIIGIETPIHTDDCHEKCAINSMSLLISLFGSVEGVNLSGVVDACRKDNTEFPDMYSGTWVKRGINPSRDGSFLVRFIGLARNYTYPLHFTSTVYDSFA